MDNLEFLRGILLQTRYRQSPEAVAVRTAVLLAAHSIPVLCSDAPGEAPLDMPVGSVAYVLDGLRRRGAAEPAVLNYPPALRPYLRRSVWTSTLGKELGTTAWIKGADHDKPFAPGLAARPDLRALDPDLPVLASEPVQWLCEWRCYVAGGRLLWRERYDRSVRPTQTCLNRFKADFLLHRGRFHSGLATGARAFLSTGCDRGTHGQVLQVDRGVQVAVVDAAAYRAHPFAY